MSHLALGVKKFPDRKGSPEVPQPSVISSEVYVTCVYITPGISQPHVVLSVCENESYKIY